MTFTLPQYATREDIKSAMDSKESDRNNVQVDRALDAASRRVEDFTNRRFYPTIGVRYFDWPQLRRTGRSWRLWLDQNEVVSLTSVVSGGVTISASDYFLEPANSGPPYNRLEIDLDSNAAFASSGTHQRQVVLTGTFGYKVTTAPAGALSGAVSSASVTTCTVTDSSLVGVGDVLVCESERMVVTGRAMVTTTATCSTLTAIQNGNTITGVTAGLVKQGEVIQIDSEKMLVTEVSGTTLTVRRGWDGSTLAVHSASTVIYAPRTLTVVRGALGTTAAAHVDATALTVLAYPGPVKQLAVAYTLDQLQQEGSAYARTVGSGDNERAASGRAIAVLETSVFAQYGRKRLGRSI